jgi:hypothetical protein
LTPASKLLLGIVVRSMHLLNSSVLAACRHELLETLKKEFPFY